MLMEKSSIGKGQRGEVYATGGMDISSGEDYGAPRRQGLKESMRTL